MDTLKKERAKSLDMTQGSPIRLLVLFAIPMLIGSVFQQMYNMTDTVVVGRFVSVEALAAIGATGSTTSLLMMLGQGLTNAVSVVISQAEGAGRRAGWGRGHDPHRGLFLLGPGGHLGRELRPAGHGPGEGGSGVQRGGAGLQDRGLHPAAPVRRLAGHLVCGPIRLGAGADPLGILSVPLVQAPRKRGRIIPWREKPPVPRGERAAFAV